MTSIAETAHLEVAKPAGPAERRGTGRWVRAVGYAAAGLSLACASATFLILLGLTPIEPTPEVTDWALIINGAVVLVLLGATVVELVRLVIAWRSGQAGSRLHGRIIGLFGAIAVTPAILVAVVASITLDRGLDNWFSNTVQNVVTSAVNLSEQYLALLGGELTSDVLQMRAQIENRSPFEEDLSPAFFAETAAAFGFRAAALIDADGNVVREAVREEGLSYPAVPQAALANAAADPASQQLIRPGQGEDNFNLIGAVVPIENAPAAFLYVVREFDAAAGNDMAVAQASATAYDQQLRNQSATQLAWGVLYFGVSLVVLLAAIWFGLGVANRIVSPIRRLIGAADNVARGDLGAEVPVRRSDGDVGTLGVSFNRMTAQLRTQREELIGASEQIDSRRRFIEAVLSGVTAAVLGVDGEGRITVLNRMALRLLDVAPDGAIGARVAELIPELAPLIEEVLADARPEHSIQISLARGGRARTINVRVTTERAATESHGYVVTMDDITDLVTAQRTSAWADVARRIAHEIKNPLTPIQLSAERLRRKFGKAITEDKAVFDQCTDTIIRQVSDIGRMVDEFSAFARMPKPALEQRDLREPVREAAFMMQVGYPEIEVHLNLPEQPVVGRFDGRLISQAVTNLIKNAAEAIAAVAAPTERGRVEVSLREADDTLVLEVTDNGIGLPQEHRHRLLEPYMTTRDKGTGLGLAIVRKIAEDHAGKIELLDAPSVAEGKHGATVRLVFPRAGAPPAADAGQAREGREAAGRATAAGARRSFEPVGG